ncbi:nSTAND1 domain-containing NTPase [Nocardia pneumoniae]|uniref:nSTAND1 domain-containing NTPase n=1 Tax=Nocardia pneumoniae TaxID=228601 RepID=UPI00030BD045|nr:TIR domain-containing protein [Nocardia pneumoniae]
MSRIFLSHSSRDSRQAIAVKRWLSQREPAVENEIFLDLDPRTGIRPGERWKQALQKANSRCEAVLCLLSARWAASHECLTEFRYAETLNKAILCARLEPVPDSGITREWQRCDLFGAGPTTEIALDDGGEPVVFTTDGLQRLLDGIRALGIGAQYFPWPPPQEPDRAPYRGWAPLEEADAAVFFGRDAQLVRGMDALRGMRASGVQSLLVILGPSGAGKSSFLRAGLLPRLRRDDHSFLPLGIVRPERAVLTGEHGLARAIHRLRTDLGLDRPLLGEIKDACLASDVERLQGWLDQARQAARDRLPGSAAGTPPPSLILPLDQAEELFSADAGPQSPRFLELLAALLARNTATTPALIVAATIRADRYEPLQTAPQLAGVQAIVFDDLKPMPPAQFKEVITGPAERATTAGRPLTIEPALVDRLLADSAQGADTLPLLALTLEHLYCDFGACGNLTLAQYQAMGGMPRIVQTEIDALLDTDPVKRAAQLDILHTAFIPWLATINPDNDQPMRRLARWSDLPADSRPLIDALVEKRLLVKDIRDGQVVVEVALESLLRQWNELEGWLDTERQDLKNADTLERAAADWENNDRHDAWLLQDTRLADAETLARKPGFRDRLEPTRDFLLASRTRENNRIHTEKQRQEAELRAAKALAATESRAKQEAQTHAAVLRKRTHVLRGVLAVTLVIALVAVVGWVIARSVSIDAQRRFLDATGLRLETEAQGMLEGTQPGGDIRAFQELLAAQSLTNTPDPRSLYAAVAKRANTVKVIAVPRISIGTALALSADGSRMASLSSDTGRVEIRDADSGKAIGEPLTGAQRRLQRVTISRDGKLIAAGGVDGEVLVWDAQAGQLMGHVAPSNSRNVTALQFSPDGHHLASGDAAGIIRIWDPATGRSIGEPLTVEPLPDQPPGVAQVAFSHDGQLLAAGVSDNSVRLWNADTRQPIAPPLTVSLPPGHQPNVPSLVFSPVGHRLVSAHGGGFIALWDADAGRPIGQPVNADRIAVAGLAFSPDGRHIVSGGEDGTLRLWNGDTIQPVGQPLRGHTAQVAGVAFSVDGSRISTAGLDGTIRWWNADEVRPLIALSDLRGTVFSSDRTRIAIFGPGGTVDVRNAATGAPMSPPLTGHKGAFSGVFSPDGHRMATVDDDEALRLWNADTGERTLRVDTGHDAVNGVAFSPDGQRVATSGSDGIRIWDARQGQLVTHMKEAFPVFAITFSPDGKRIVASVGRTVRQLDARTGDQISDLSGHNSVSYDIVFSPDRRRIATIGQDGTVRLWNAEDGKPLRTLPGHQKQVTSVAFSPDGHRLVSGDGSGTFRLWNPETGEPTGAVVGAHDDVLIGLSFSPDGQRVVSASYDDTVRVWPAHATPADLCHKLAANMSRKQWRNWVSPKIDYIKACPELPLAPDDGAR